MHATHSSRNDLLHLNCIDDRATSNLQPVICWKRHAFLHACVVNASVKGVVRVKRLKDEVTGVAFTPVLHSCSCGADLIEVGDAVARALVLARPGHPHPVVIGLQPVVTPPHQCIANVHCMKGTKSLPAFCQFVLCTGTTHVLVCCRPHGL